MDGAGSGERCTGLEDPQACRHGRGVFGGLGYAVFYPAVYVEKTTLLRVLLPALLLAMLLQPLVGDSSFTSRQSLRCGALLGLTITIKVWGVVTVLIVLGWLLLLRRYGAALRVMIGSAVAATVICLPFFAAAPTAMWNQIVRDQVSRARRSNMTILERLHEMAGLGIIDRALPLRSLWPQWLRCSVARHSPGVTVRPALPCF